MEKVVRDVFATQVFQEQTKCLTQQSAKAAIEQVMEEKDLMEKENKTLQDKKWNTSKN